MTSRNDDTLALPGSSQELSFDVTVDEDFIPPSQPQSTDSSKIPKNSDVSFSKTIKKLECTDTISDSNIVETPPSKSVIDQSALEWDESADFIPETETKDTKISFPDEDFSYKERRNFSPKKELLVFNSEDIFKNQSNPTWNTDVSKIPESPISETLNISILNDSPTKISSNQETVRKFEESVTEIIVNDSAETVDLEATPVKIKKLESETAVGELEISCSLNYDAEKCEETQVFDNSSVLLLGQPGTASDVEKNEISEVISEELYLQQTTDDNEAISQKELKNFNSGFGPPSAVAKQTKHSDIKKDAGDVHRPDESSLLQKEVPLNSLCTEQTTGSIITRKVDFKLTVSCFVTINTKTNKILQKIISKVQEIPKSKPKPVYVEHSSDTTSDKSKRYSTSSSGSVYSDKMGLPFALPKRVSDLTDSSEDEFGLLFKEGRRALGRVPWSNEYLLPLKMDDMMQMSIENEELLKRPEISSPRKPKNRRCDVASHLKEILESSSSEQTSFYNLDTQEHFKAINSEEVLEKEISGSSEMLFTEEVKKLVENVRNERSKNINEREQPKDREKKHKSSELVTQELNIEFEAKQMDSAQKIRQIEGQVSLEEEYTPISLCDGLPVFARWTDKLYYSGVLSGNVKNDRWEVKFDDGTSKAVREDFIMPAEWLKSGALVFVLTDDKYESGQLLSIKKGDEVNYVVELDTNKKEVSVKISDLCLTDVMAGIVGEKYKPLVGTPKRKADIDFDNVLSGKRIRDQKTPLKTPFTVPAMNSGAKNKSSSKAKKASEVGLEPLNKASSNKNCGPTVGLKSENGHLLEDKVISADSPSGNEAIETPLRGKPKEPRGKAKPRSLSYESEETRLKKNWLAPDGTPIPGPSGVKLKKQKTKSKTGEAKIPALKDKSPTVVTRSKKKLARPEISQPTERSKRKRKLNESVEGSIQKKSLKERSSKVKRKIKK